LKAVNRPICVCADDFGLSPAVSNGILQAVEAGRISATSAMTNRPDWVRGADALRPFADRVEVGLHLNLTLGAPVSSAQKIAPGGRFPLIAAWMRGTPPPADEIRAEVRAQLDAFVAAWGGPPDYVDGHQHVHALPAVRDVLLDELSERGLAGRLWLRNSGDKIARILARRSVLPKALVLAWIARGFAKAAKARGFATNDGFSGFSAFDPRRPVAPDFARFLKATGPRHLIMCHPGLVDDELARLDPVTTKRSSELSFLLSPDWPAQLARASLQLGRWQRSP
jgi:predicted glycoside hydrolase/deacetylase ChbG (UPF0249 family)